MYYLLYNSIMYNIEHRYMIQQQGFSILFKHNNDRFDHIIFTAYLNFTHLRLTHTRT